MRLNAGCACGITTEGTESVTLTQSMSNGPIHIALYEIAGVASAGCVDQTAAKNGSTAAQISALVVLVAVACSSPQVARDRGPAQPTARYVLPPPKEVREGTGAFVLSKRTQLRGEPSAVALLREELHASDGSV